jgi:hypothetical protein
MVFARAVGRLPPTMEAASWYQNFCQRGDFETVRAFAAKTLPRPVIHLDLVKDNRFVVICSAGTAP